MNQYLAQLQPYPFEKLHALFAGVSPDPACREIKLSIGEPQHPTPDFVMEGMARSLKGLANYPSTQGTPGLRQAISSWIKRRYDLDLNPDTEILPVNGSREALFSFTQAMIDSSPGKDPVVVSPNPFYQIYEGAALLAGARVRLLNTLPENDFALDLDALDAETWARVQLLFVCSPGNPTGKVLNLEEWQALFRLSDRYGFTIASDECYSEIYFDEACPPLGGLQAAHLSGRNLERLVIFSSLSKRSNVPGMRSGFVAGDPKLLKQFLLYRTYHGCAMAPPTQATSILAWNDEAHVLENRNLYRQKFDAVLPILAGKLETKRPDAGFYLWARTPGSDTEFARDLLEACNVVVLPGSYLGRTVDGVNPGSGFVRIALVAGFEDCCEAASRISKFITSI